jgi:hypothetical protein
MGQPAYYKKCEFINKFTNQPSGCGMKIGWDGDDKQWREEGTNKLHTKERCKEIRTASPNLQVKQLLQPQQAKLEDQPSEQKKEETNPIKEKVESEKSGGDFGRRFELMWTMIKGINSRLDKLDQVKKDQGDLIDAIATWKNEQEKFISDVYNHLVPVKDQMKSASELNKKSDGEFDRLMKREQQEIKQEEIPPPEDEPDSEDNSIPKSDQQVDEDETDMQQGEMQYDQDKADGVRD